MNCMHCGSSAVRASGVYESIGVGVGAGVGGAVAAKGAILGFGDRRANRKRDGRCCRHVVRSVKREGNRSIDR